MAHLFISHSTRDGGAIAQQLAAALEAAGHRCWIAPRDVKPGVPYPGQIVAAIRDCAGLVLIVTPAANESPDVLQEVQIAGQNRKTVAPVVVSGTKPSDDLHYFIGVRHQIAWSGAATVATELRKTFPAPQKLDVASTIRQLDSIDQRAVAIQAELDTLRDMVGPAALMDLTWEVFLISTNGRNIDAIKIIREYTRLDLAEAKALVESTPPIRVGHRLTHLAAFSYVSKLKAIGANVMEPVKSKT